VNIFYLDPDPRIAASYHCDRHVIKMILESAQLLCTAHRVLDGDDAFVHPYPHMEQSLYKCTHRQHPCAIWVRESEANYHWLYRLMTELNAEFVRRYNKKSPHATIVKLSKHLESWPENMDWRPGFTTPPQCMPEELRGPDCVEAYRRYYVANKASIASWTNTPIPFWFPPSMVE
jgi:hypothetical protein